ncbi:transposase [Spiroplasma endosymbiont of Glossina fuscipes fuscipes]|uniref:transposase n=1 Tax=Spiroplasma endosymbiont of Glossina fuscipes fuscipes TaxID=2004463 RepID=UPI003C740BEE
MAKNHYTDEFKQQIVGLYKSGKTSGQLSNDYQIGKSTVWKWVHEFNNSGSFKAKDNRSVELMFELIINDIMYIYWLICLIVKLLAMMLVLIKMQN